MGANKMRKHLTAADYELETDIDRHEWLKNHPVYCPVSYCAAYRMRYAECGDKDGSYDGLHQARISYAKRFVQIEKERVAFLSKLGMKNPEFAAGMERARQDSIDMGLSPGRRGRRRPL